jgi:hypothetical protein
MDLMPKKHLWKSWDQLLNQQLKAGKAASELDSQRLKLQSTIQRSHTAKSSEIDKERAKQAEDLLRQNAEVSEILSSLLEEIRLNILETTKNPSELRTTRKLLLLASQEFIDSQTLMEGYRDSANHPLQKQEQLDFAKAWVSWQSIAGKILLAIKEDEKFQSQWLDKKIKEIENLRSLQGTLQADSNNLRSRLQSATAKSLPSVLSNYQFHIRQQQSRANKWLADLQWQRYVIQTEEKMKLRSQVEKKETEVQESLKDLEIERTIHD